MLDLSHLTCMGEALRDSIVTHKSNVALIEADRHVETGRYTYRELKAAAERFAAALQARGFGPGDRCAIVMSNQSRWLLSATGAMWAGAVLVPIDHKLTAPEQAALLAHARPRVLVTEASAWPELRAAIAPEQLERLVVVVAGEDDPARLGPAIAWDAAEGPQFTYVARAREDVACIVYSSGTSGTPKGCMLTHGNYLAQAEVLGRMYPIAEDERYFSVLPTNHAIDFMVGFFVPLLCGAAVVHQRTLRPQFLGPTMRRYGVTHMALVPTILKNIQDRLEERLDKLPRWQRRTLDLLVDANELLTRRKVNHGLSRLLLGSLLEGFGKLKLVFAGGAFVEAAVAEYFYARGIPVVIGYGLTEAGTVLTVNDLKPFRPDTVGRPIEGVELEIRGADEHGVGEVWVRGPTVFAGYLDAPELTGEALIDGWLRTGDLGQLDAAGHLKLRGRAKNMIVTEGGKNVYPEDIEAAFDDLPGVDELCVFAANYIWPQQTMTGEQLVVVARPDRGRTLAPATLAELVRRNRKLAEFKRVSGVIVWTEEFPRTASQKLKRAALAQALRGLARESAIEELTP
jgi:long-chain acyl-CoA synthetase